MTYPIDTTIPNAPNDPADDQPKMKDNFNNINSYLSVDHIVPGAVNNGYHKQVHLINEAAPGLVGADGVLFANAVSGISWPFWQNSSGTFQILGSNTLSGDGYITLPGGFIIMWGTVSLTGADSAKNVPVSFAAITGIAFPNACFTVMLTLTQKASSSSSDNTLGRTASSLTATGFNYNFNGTGNDFPSFDFIAIGN